MLHWGCCCSRTGWGDCWGGLAMDASTVDCQAAPSHKIPHQSLLDTHTTPSEILRDPHSPSESLRFWHTPSESLSYTHLPHSQWASSLHHKMLRFCWASGMWAHLPHPWVFCSDNHENNCSSLTINLKGNSFWQEQIFGFLGSCTRLCNSF